MYDGIYPESVKTLLLEKAMLEDERLLKEGQLEKLVEKRIKAALIETQKQGKAADQRAATLEARLVETEIRSSHRTPK